MDSGLKNNQQNLDTFLLQKINNLVHMCTKEELAKNDINYT